MRYFLDISYVGTPFAGWQVQKNAIGIQQILNEKLGIVLRHKADCFASGRTDAGVHAIQQMVQFDTEVEIEPFRWLLQLNALLPKEIVANAVYKVQTEASARFDALSRSYIYKISSQRNPFLHQRVLFLFKELNLDKINSAASKLLIHNDFESFSKVHTDVNHFRCTIQEAEMFKEGSLLIFKIKANRFLRGMVRTIVGTLIEVGLGKISVEQFEEIIRMKDRRQAGQAVLADGLYLYNIEYPEHIYLV